MKYKLGKISHQFNSQIYEFSTFQMISYFRKEHLKSIIKKKFKGENKNKYLSYCFYIMNKTKK